MVDDQEKALAFYTEVLGFQNKVDLPAGEYRWISLVSPEAPDGMQLVLEPNANPAGRTYQKALYDQEIPATAFTVDDIQQEYERLKSHGVHFSLDPTTEHWGTMATFDDTVGNLIQINQF